MDPVSALMLGIMGKQADAQIRDWEAEQQFKRQKKLKLLDAVIHDPDGYGATLFHADEHGDGLEGDRHR